MAELPLTLSTQRGARHRRHCAAEVAVVGARFCMRAALQARTSLNIPLNACGPKVVSRSEQHIGPTD